VVHKRCVSGGEALSGLGSSLNGENAAACGGRGAGERKVRDGGSDGSRTKSHERKCEMMALMGNSDNAN